MRKSYIFVNFSYPVNYIINSFFNVITTTHAMSAFRVNYEIIESHF